MQGEESRSVRRVKKIEEGRGEGGYIRRVRRNIVSYGEKEKGKGKMGTEDRESENGRTSVEGGE